MKTNHFKPDTKADKLLTLSDIASYLQITEKTLLKMVHKKEIPSIKIGSQWRFVKEAIDQWLFSRMQQSSKKNTFFEIESTINYIPVDRLLRKDTILMDINPGTKESILNTLIQPLLEKELIKDKDYYLSRLLQRENIVSTGLSKGFAIPHIRHVDENPPNINIIVAGICRPGTNFDSIDGKKTKLFFLVCSDSEILHIRIIARLSRIFNNVNTINEFIALKTREEFMDLFIKYNHALNFPEKEENK
ncbi:MAG: PTS sugar transporter subunit IIA [Spirochaetales bacterium]|nr:PTS sugar transporter subunit IIA [Spirochaetales bacterium]